MQKKTKPLKTLRLRKESLKVLTTEQLAQVHGGDCCAYGGTAINSVSNPGPLHQDVG
jgi:hypothetical protein